MLKNGLHFKLFGSGPITSAGVEAGAFVSPEDPEGEPTIQAFCVPIVYLDRDFAHIHQGHVRGDHHDGCRQAEIARHGEAALRRPFRHAAGIAEPAQA